MVSIKKAETDEELQGILFLQRKNLKNELSERERDKEGFVTLKHDLATLQIMNSYEPQIIAVDNGIVVGYALVMVRNLRNTFLELIPMFHILDTLSFGAHKIADSKYYVMGQICIDKAYRSTGLFAKLYDHHKTVFSSRYEYCVTEVSNQNLRSLKAHRNVGFQDVHTFSDETDQWTILLLAL